jgi:hypothetical protein
VSIEERLSWKKEKVGAPKVQSRPRKEQAVSIESYLSSIDCKVVAIDCRVVAIDCKVFWIDGSFGAIDCSPPRTEEQVASNEAQAAPIEARARPIESSPASLERAAGWTIATPTPLTRDRSQSHKAPDDLRRGRMRATRSIPPGIRELDEWDKKRGPASAFSRRRGAIVTRGRGRAEARYCFVLVTVYVHISNTPPSAVVTVSETVPVQPVAVSMPEMFSFVVYPFVDSVQVSVKLVPPAPHMKLHPGLTVGVPPS